MKINLIIQLRSGAKIYHVIEAETRADAFIEIHGAIENTAYRNDTFVRLSNEGNPLLLNASAIEAIYEDISAEEKLRRQGIDPTTVMPPKPPADLPAGAFRTKPPYESLFPADDRRKARTAFAPSDPDS